MAVTGFIQMNPVKALALLKFRSSYLKLIVPGHVLDSFKGPSKFSCALVRLDDDPRELREFAGTLKTLSYHTASNVFSPFFNIENSSAAALS